MQFKSEEVNYLIYRYLLESGFTHSAFLFSHESLLSHSASLSPLFESPEQLPAGALITLLHRGLQYTDIELHTNEDGSARPCSRPVLLLERHLCSTEETPGGSGLQPDKPLFRAGVPSKDLQRKIKEAPPSISVLEHPHPHPSPAYSKIPDESIITLSGHQGEVYTCAWNPKESFLATGAGDSTARIWNLSNPADSIDQSTVLSDPSAAAGTAPSFIITTLEWDQTGTRIAAGSSEGGTYVWSSAGTLIFSSKNHSASIFSIRWDADGEHLLTGSEDSKVILQRSTDGSPVKTFLAHSGSVLDVDWRDSTVFASCSQDATIRIFSIESDDPLLTLSGHEKEINAVKWDPTGAMLASCSDDKTARIWRPLEDDPSANQLLFSLTGHSDGIYTVEWNPNPSLHLLGTASFDGTARMWNTQTGTCIYTLAKHTKPVYSISFSPEGSYIATGSVDKNVLIWDTQSGRLLHGYTSKGGVYDLSWSPDGQYVGVCTTKSQAFVIRLGSVTGMKDRMMV